MLSAIDYIWLHFHKCSDFLEWSVWFEADNEKNSFFFKKSSETFAGSKKRRTFASQLRNKPTQSEWRSFERANAQMAESVDALVSNTSGFTSIPVRPRVWVLRWKLSSWWFNYLAFSFYRRCSQIVPNHPYVFHQRWAFISCHLLPLV